MALSSGKMRCHIRQLRQLRDCAAAAVSSTPKHLPPKIVCHNTNARASYANSTPCLNVENLVDLATTWINGREEEETRASPLSAGRIPALTLIPTAADLTRVSPYKGGEFDGGLGIFGAQAQLGFHRKVCQFTMRRSELSGIRVWQSFSRSHMGHAHHHPGEHDKSGKSGQRVLGWGLWGDMFLAVGKGGAGFVSGSTAIIADAAHSVSDIALSGVVLWTSKVAHTPKDKQHPYGHGKFESVGALGISAMLLLTGGAIAWHAAETLQPFIPMLSDLLQTAHDHERAHGDGHQHGIDLQHPFVALSAAIVSIGVKESLYWQTKRVGEQQQSELLKASAWHHRSDAISSVVALIGVGGAILGLPLLDPLAGLFVSGMIAKAGLETGYQSLQDLVDSGVQESVLSPIRKTVLHVQGVEGCHHLRGRRMGSFIHVDAHIEVDPWLSVSAAHNIAEVVRHQLSKEHPEVAETFVHIEPADGGTKTDLQDHHSHSEDADGHSHELSFKKKDLTKEGSKADLMTSDASESSQLPHSSHSSEEACVDDSFDSESRPHPDLDQDVRQVVGANFLEKMSINHVTSHFLQGRVVVEVEVSMNPEISVRDAMEYANDAEQAILQNVSDISAVRVQLKLNKGMSHNT